MRDGLAAHERQMMTDTPGEDPASELARLLEDLARRDDPEERFAYDGSNEPQQRPLEPEERALLNRIIGIVADEPRWQYQAIVWKTEIRAAIGDGKQSQLRDLTARERDDLCRMVTLLTSDFSSRQREPHPYLAYLDSVTRADIARLNLIDLNINARSGDVDRRVVVHADDWAPPVDIPPGWWVAAAPRPLEGPLTWQDNDHGHGRYYAACPPDQDHDTLGWYTDRREHDAWPVIAADNLVISATVHRYLAQFGCQTPEDADMTIAQVARDLGLPWREQAGAEARDTPGGQPTRAEDRTNAHPPAPASDEQLPPGADAQQTAAARSLASANFPSGLSQPGITRPGNGPTEAPSQPGKARRRGRRRGA
jgi:hypothetical protein